MPSPARNIDDISLVRSVRNGDREAFGLLFQRYFNNLAAVAHHITRDRDSAEDVAQNVMIGFWSKRDEISISTNVGGYLRQMAIREALGQKRTTVRRAQLLGDSPLPSSEAQHLPNPAEYNELETSINRAIDALPEKCGEVFRLSRYEQLSYKEIAEALDISVKTVENHMGRALRELRVALRDYLTMLL